MTSVTGIVAGEPCTPVAVTITSHVRPGGKTREVDGVTVIWDPAVESDSHATLSDAVHASAPAPTVIVFAAGRRAALRPPRTTGWRA